MSTQITITKDEKRALVDYLSMANICRSGCAYPEMEKSNKDCDDCLLTKSTQSLLEKLVK